MNSLSTSSPKRTVLVVASDRANLRLMSQLISRRADLNLLKAVNGKEGMQLADASRPEVVVLDTSLSDISAGLVLKHLLNSPIAAYIPVIAVSDEAMPAHVEGGLKAGFYRYLTKPYKLTDLLQAIDSSLLYSQGKSQGRQTVGVSVVLTQVPTLNCPTFMGGQHAPTNDSKDSPLGQSISALGSI